MVKADMFRPIHPQKSNKPNRFDINTTSEKLPIHPPKILEIAVIAINLAPHSTPIFRTVYMP
jgi:hypothetical protein